MKRKVLVVLLCITMLFTATLGASCSLIRGLLGGGNVAREKSNEFIRVMNGVFESASFNVVEYIPSGGSSGGNGGGSGGSSGGGQGGTSDKSPNHTSPDPFSLNVVKAESQPVEPSEFMEELVDAFIGNGGIPLNETNKKAINGEALSRATSYAGMVKALIAVYGDNVFEKNYTYSSVTFSLSEKDGVYTVMGVLNRDGAFSSGIMVNFSEKGGEYAFSYGEFSSLMTYGNGMQKRISEIRFAYYNSEVGAMSVDLRSDEESALYNFENAADKFEVEKILACSFDLENYVADDLYESTETQSKAILSFAKNVLGFSNQTVSNIKEIKSTAQIKDDEVATINEMAARNYYVSPYYYQTNDTFVRETYRVPENVTVIEKASIPATKVVYIHQNVTKIESMPFEKPQYVEEIIFENPDNGKLTQIGSFDQTKNGRPTFILSMTKVKNFTLPKTVKKLELGDYVVNTVVEKLDLSSYAPSWINDKSQFTYKFLEDDFYHGMENYCKDEYRNKAYVTLNICGGTHVTYKEVRYINELYMPQFNMGIEFDTWYGLQLGDKGDTIYAFDFITKLLQATEIPHSEWIAQQNYTLTYDMIGKLYINDINTIVSEDLLYGDFEIDESSPDSDKDKDKKDKDNLNSKGEEYGRDAFEITLYDDEFHSDFSHDGDKAQTMGGANYYCTIKEIIVSNANYQSIFDAEEEIFDNKIHSTENLINGRVKVTKK